jgi:hypothetical protein
MSMLDREVRLIESALSLADDHHCELRTRTLSSTEGGARTVTLRFVLLPDEEGRQTTIEEHVNGNAKVEPVFHAPRAHRPGAEGE